MKKLILIFVVFAMSSCLKFDDQLYDKIPEDKFPENEDQAALVVIPAYQELADLIDDAGWWFWAQEVTSDEVVFPVRLTDWEDGGKWRVLHTHEWDNNTDAVNSMWSHMYDGVFEANRAIDGLISNQSDPATNVVISKLRALRAYYYYLLIDNYGDVPLITSFFDAPELPMKDSREDIYAFLIDELEESIPYLPVNTNKYAVSKGMAMTLLAKLYLNAEVYIGTPHWKDAENWCDSIIDLGVYTLEANALAPFTYNNDNSPENIFTIPFDEFDLKGFRIHMRTLHYQHNLTYDMPVGPWNGCAAVEDHYDLYESQDARKEGFIVGQQYTSAGAKIVDATAEVDLVIDPHIPALVMDASYTLNEIRNSGARIGKFEIEPGIGEDMNNNFPIFRYADVLLMKAECVIRQGGNGDGYIQEVRDRAKASIMSGFTLDMLLDERGRELFCEGHRRQDLIRFGKFGSPWWEKPASGPDRELFPIPQWAIDANPNLGL